MQKETQNKEGGGDEQNMRATQEDPGVNVTEIHCVYCEKSQRSPLTWTISTS